MTTKKDALIIFARKPEAGKVKTRLASTIGNEKALAVYIKLLQHTRDIIRPLVCDKHLFVTERNQDYSFWEGFTQELQNGAHLGERMLHAFQVLFRKGYQHVLIIGTDCPYLTTNIIDCAFAALRKTDVVIGPATDGGYYLLGMNSLKEKLFKNKNWSTASVFRDTMNDLHTAGWHYELLPELTDVDEEVDVPEGWL